MKNYSIWEDIADIECPELKDNKEVQVLIVGGGITGISTLIHLKKDNLKVILVERNKCGYGTTGKSTAKITYLQERIYMNLRKNLNDTQAKNYLDSQRYAVNLIKDLIVKNKIDCDLKQVPSYLFTTKEDNIKKIEEEYNFLMNNGVDVTKVTNVFFNKNVKLALKVNDTYVFHPLKYINYWKNKYKDSIYENSKLEAIKKVKGGYVCLVNGKIIKTKYLVLGMHYPYFLKPFFLPTKSYVEASYIGAKNTKGEDFSAINIDNPTISMRRDNNNFIYLYNSFKIANIKEIKKNFQDLLKQDNFQYIWSNNDIITNDYLPFIGEIDKGMFLGTGYNTWGMTNGSLAGEIISSLILKKDNKYKDLMAPKRALNLSKLERLPSDIYGNIKAICKSTKNNVNNNKVINKVIKGKKVLIYIDENNNKHIVLNKCPHLKCGIVFNEIEKTWECLCHGSRFDIDGKLINGPSNFDITFK